MRVGNLRATSGALRKALKMLRLRWQEAKTHWNDQVSRDFEENQLNELELQCEHIAEHIDHLAQVLTKAYEECSR